MVLRSNVLYNDHCIGHRIIPSHLLRREHLRHSYQQNIRHDVVHLGDISLYYRDLVSDTTTQVDQ